MILDRNGMPSELIAVLQGGLGNQMFIYSAARAIALEKGLDLKLDVESGFKQDYRYQRSFSLKGFKVQAAHAAKGECLWRPFNWKRRYLRYLGNRLNLTREVLVEDQNAGFDPKLIDRVPTVGRVYLLGYFQSEQYFGEIKPELFRDFGFKDERELNSICTGVIGDPARATCVHVRLFNDHADERERLRSYYRRAIAHLQSLGISDRIFVVSESIDGAREVIDSDLQNLVFLESGGRTELEDFYILSRCRNIVIGESTFSWWAGWVGEKHFDNRLVIAPASRKQGGVSAWGFEGLIPERWLSL